MTGGDLFASPLVEPALSQLNCNGSEDSIAECTNNTVDVETCSLSVAVCQGITKPQSTIPSYLIYYLFAGYKYKLQ